MTKKLGKLKQNKRSLYDRAIDALINLIKNNQYQIGDQLPSENQLSDQLGISRTTLREAISYLERQGVVSRRHGVGTFISLPPQNSLQGGIDELISLKALAKKINEKYERLVWEITDFQADSEIASALLLNPEDNLIRVQMVIAIEERVFAYLDSYMDKNLTEAEKLRAYPDGSLLDFLLEKQDLDISHTLSNIYAVNADQQISEMMSLPIGAPLLHLVETYQTQQGHPVVHTFNYFGTDVINFHINRRIVPISIFNRRTLNEDH